MLELFDVRETAPDRFVAPGMAKPLHDALFGGQASVWTALRMREFYALQEEVLDRCEDAAKTIEEILIENT